MSTRVSMLALAAVATLAISALIPGSASAFGRGSHASAPVRATTPTAAPAVVSHYRYGGYGRGWCYWHPYACYRF